MNQTEWLSNLSVSDIVFINTYNAGQEIYPIKKPKRPYHAFIYTLEGVEIYDFGDKVVKTYPDTLLYIPKDGHYYTTLEGEKSVVVCVDFELCDIECPNPFLLSFSNPLSIRSTFCDMDEKWEKSMGYKALCKSLFYSAISQIIFQKTVYFDSKQVNALGRSLEYLNANFYKNDFRIEDLYKIAELSPKYYGTLFYRQFAMTPKEYVLFLKIGKAKKLLAGENCSVKNVANEIGYGDIYYFSRIFKQKVGCSPSAYKRSLKK